MFIVEIDKDIIGYKDVKPELNTGRVILDCRVHPQHRRKGLARKLIENATNRAYTGTWGYNPNTVEEIAFQILRFRPRQVNSSTSSWKDVVLIYDRDKAIDYCWTGVS